MKTLRFILSVPFLLPWFVALTLYSFFGVIAILIGGKKAQDIIINIHHRIAD